MNLKTGWGTSSRLEGTSTNSVLRWAHYRAVLCSPQHLRWCPGWFALSVRK